jgi:predicted nucleotidyltransferase
MAVAIHATLCGNNALKKSVTVRGTARCSDSIVVVLESMSGRIDRNTEQALHRFMALVSQSYRTCGAILYGSRARGDHTPDSDADLLVLLEGEHLRFLPTKLAMTDLAYDVLLETGLYISPLPVWTDEWEHPEAWSNPDLLRNIAREGVHL